MSKKNGKKKRLLHAIKVKKALSGSVLGYRSGQNALESEKHDIRRRTLFPLVPA